MDGVSTHQILVGRESMLTSNNHKIVELKSHIAPKPQGRWGRPSRKAQATTSFSPSTRLRALWPSNQGWSKYRYKGSGAELGVQFQGEGTDRETCRKRGLESLLEPRPGEEGNERATRKPGWGIGKGVME